MSPTESHASKNDRLFVGLFLLQWAAEIGVAYARPLHDEAVFVAIFCGALIASVPTMLVVWKPGTIAARHAIAAAQVLFGGLLVHLTKGAHHTSAHAFFSLSMLALYRDPKVIATGALVAAGQAFAFGPTNGVEQALWIASVAPFLVHLARGEARSLVVAKVEAPKVEASKVEAPKAEAPKAEARAVEGPPVVDDVDPDSTQILCLIPSKPPSSRRIDCSILLVEDDPQSQRILVDHLERAGVSVAIAPNGEVAVSEVSAASERGKPFDLVLMDMHMPIMNGYEATAELRRRGYDAPIIAMKGDERRSIDAGCTEYLTKAMSRDHLIQIVANHGLGSAATVPPPARALTSDAIYSSHPDFSEMQELLHGFVTRLHQNADEIDAAQATSNTAELGLIAQRLRGAAASFGFIVISEAAGVLEDELRAGRPTGAASKQLASLCRRAQTRNFARAA